MIYIHVCNLQPLCVAAEQAQGTVRRALDYIPGSALRGALAAHLRTVRPNISQQDFDRIILGPGAQFRNLYPRPQNREAALPLPRTAHSCKLYPGFQEPRPEVGLPPRHGVCDHLFAFLRYQAAATAERETHLPDPYCQVDVCHLPMEPFGAYYDGLQAGDYVVADIQRRQVTQTAIDPHRETAREANLFTLEVLEEDMQFAGHFALGEGTDEADFCRTVSPKDSTLRIGYGRTRGLGLVQVLDCRVDTRDYWPDDLATRLRRFNETAQAQQCNVSEHTLFALTLLSDAIVLDPFFRHQARLDGPALGREIHPNLADATLLLSMTDTRLVSGWSSPHHLPLPEDRAMTAGSVFVFETNITPGELVEIFAETNLERRGLGERTSEGFGQVAVCHPFHREVSPV